MCRKPFQPDGPRYNVGPDIDAINQYTTLDSKGVTLELIEACTERKCCTFDYVIANSHYHLTLDTCWRNKLHAPTVPLILHWQP